MHGLIILDTYYYRRIRKEIRHGYKNRKKKAFYELREGLTVLDINDLSQRINALNIARNEVRRIRETYKEQPNLLSFYEPSALYMVDTIVSDIQSVLYNIMHECSISIDVWVKLVGRGFTPGRAPIGVVGQYLQRLSVVNQHAVGLLENITHVTGRIHKKVHDLAEFDLVAMAPGSFQLGLQRPAHYINEFSQQALLNREGEAKALQVLNESKRSLEGLQLIVSAIKGLTDDTALDEVEAQVHGRNNTLKLLHYVKELTPSAKSIVDTISFFGRDLFLDHPIEADKNSRKLLQDKIKALRQNQEFVEGKALIRAVDLDKRNIRARPFYAEGRTHDDLECKFPQNVTEQDMERYLNQFVQVSGFLTFTSTGEIRHLEIDEVIVEPEDEQEYIEDEQ